MYSIRTINIFHTVLKTAHKVSNLRQLATSSALSGHWFSKGRKKVDRLPSKEISFDRDWEHELWRGAPKEELLPHVEDLKDFDQADETIKKLFTFEYWDFKEQCSAEIQKALKEHADPAFTGRVGRLIIIYTYLIRKYKTQLKTNPKGYRLRKLATVAIKLRKYLLISYRRTHYSDFERLCRELNIQFQHANPFNYTDLSEEHHRAKLIKDQFYQQRKKRIEDYLLTLDTEKSQLKSEKEKILPELTQKLSQLGLSLEDVFHEVVQERQEELMAPVVDDQCAWFEREKELKVHYAKIRAEKLERRMKSKRR